MRIREIGIAIAGATLMACFDPPLPEECWFDLAYDAAGERLVYADDCQRVGLYTIGDEADEPALLAGSYVSRVAIASERVFATNDFADVLRVFDGESGELLEQSEFVQTRLGEIVVTPNEDAVWVTAWHGNQVGVGLFDTDRAQLRAFYSIEGDPIALDIDEAQRLLVVPSEEGTVTILNSLSYEVVATFDTIGALDGLLIPGAGHAAILEDEEERIEILDASTLAPIMTLETGRKPRRLAVSAGGELLAVTERSDGTLRVFDTSTYEVLGVYDVAGNPDALALTPDGRAFVGLIGSRSIVELSLATGEILRRF